MVWRAIYCLAGRELKARDDLKAMGLDVFAPHDLVKIRRKAPGRNHYRIVDDVQAVFPRYIFVRDNGDRNAWLANASRNVVTPVRVGELLLSISDSVMFALRVSLGCDDQDTAARRDATLPSA